LRVQSWGRVRPEKASAGEKSFNVHSLVRAKTEPEAWRAGNIVEYFVIGWEQKSLVF
jgi:hypothetical protein